MNPLNPQSLDQLPGFNVELKMMLTPARLPDTGYLMAVRSRAAYYWSRRGFPRNVGKALPCSVHELPLLVSQPRKSCLENISKDWYMAIRVLRSVLHLVLM